MTSVDDDAAGQYDRDADPHDGRRETMTERLDRNWDEILQELRVIQTGTQILTGFLLAAVFQSRFSDLDDYQKVVYASLVVVTILTTIMGLAPVGVHRFLFRQHAKATVVRVADRFLQLTMAGVAITLAGTAMLIFDFVFGHVGGVIAGVGVLAVVIVLWAVLPRSLRARVASVDDAVQGGGNGRGISTSNGRRE
jgi:MFS family permease